MPETGAAGAASPRERYRTQVCAEIKERAWDQLGTAGASALSLNAIAKQMGMSGPALYRYFDNRDALITELIRDAYRSLADTFHAAVADGAHASAEGEAAVDADADADADAKADAGAGRRPDAAVLAYALRRWALADPQRYLLIYGTPVPGYHAPDEVTAIAAEIMAVLLDACAALPLADRPATPFDADLAEHRDWARGHAAGTPVLRRALAFWTRLHGVLSLELSGHFTGMAFDPGLMFAAEVDDLLAG
ncbi:TetR/AcrR family transcriptional regulator [Streptomyces sp. NPDC020917]|uniref:TetR/AcrR family transcriptional regulator n=1 Tax=Streptomyces sp. NPDC020917 TaxID=3365102 RepID=UPI0037A93043